MSGSIISLSCLLLPSSRALSRSKGLVSSRTSQTGSVASLASAVHCPSLSAGRQTTTAPGSSSAVHDQRTATTIPWWGPALSPAARTGQERTSDVGHVSTHLPWSGHMPKESPRSLTEGLYAFPSLALTSTYPSQEPK